MAEVFMVSASKRVIYMKDQQQNQTDYKVTEVMEQVFHEEVVDMPPFRLIQTQSYSFANDLLYNQIDSDMSQVLSIAKSARPRRTIATS